MAKKLVSVYFKDHKSKFPSINKTALMLLTLNFI